MYNNNGVHLCNHCVHGKTSSFHTEKKCQSQQYTILKMFQWKCNSDLFGIIVKLYIA